MMIDKISRWLVLILIGYIGAQAWHVFELKEANSEYKAQLDLLEAESQSQHDQYDKAYKKAQESIKQSQDEVDQIMKENVSSKCKDAMKWAIQQAKSFKA